jgi:flagellar basal body-associated protein FliL
MKKGITLPVSTLIIIIVSVLVMVAVVGLWYIGWIRAEWIKKEAALSEGCTKLVNGGCVSGAETTITVSYDVDKNGIVGDAGDTLWALCQDMGFTTQIRCRQRCGCTA